MHAHIHGRHELVTSAAGKMWCRLSVLSTLRNLTKSQYDMGMQTLCKHIPSHTYIHLNSVCWGKNTTFVCLGGFGTCFAAFTYKVNLLFKAHLCIFLLNRLGTPSCIEQTSARAGPAVCRMTWRQEQLTVCVPAVTERSVALNVVVYALALSRELWPSSFSDFTCGCVRLKTILKEDRCIYLRRLRHRFCWSGNLQGWKMKPRQTCQRLQFFDWPAEAGSKSGSIPIDSHSKMQTVQQI